MLSQDEVIVGDVKVLTGGQVEKVLVGSIARTTTAAKTIGILPAGATITDLTVWGPTGSDAGTTATLSVGKSGGTGAEYLSAQSIASSAGAGKVTTTGATALGAVGSSAVTVTGTYAETGTASTTGGPWQVRITFVTATS